MKSYEYAKLIKSTPISSIYKTTVSRQLGIFVSIPKIKNYIESKTKRILLDYELKYDIKWNKDKKKTVKLLKNNIISFSEYQITNNNEGFLTDIAYSIAIALTDTLNKQNIIKFEFIDVLSFISFRFFNISISNNNNISLLIDSLFFKDIENNIFYKELNKLKRDCFEKENIQAVLYYHNDYNLFYFKHNLRYYLYKINTNQA